MYNTGQSCVLDSFSRNRSIIAALPPGDFKDGRCIKHGGFDVKFRSWWATRGNEPNCGSILNGRMFLTIGGQTRTTGTAIV
jgi:hypothetical protein